MTTTSSRTGRTSTPRRPTEFDYLWSVLPHPPGSVVRLFARVGDHREGDFAESAREVRKFAETYPRHNVYVAPNPTSQRGGTRHSARDVTHWSYFLIDMDPVCTCPPDRARRKLPKCDTCRGKADPLSAVFAALLWLGEWVGRDFGLGPGLPIIIDSGRGVQAWIRLEDVLLTDAENEDDLIGGPWELLRSVARRVNGYWLKRLDEKLGVTHGCRIDTSVSDLPRVMRCPGTRNAKTRRIARFVNSTPRIYDGLAKLLVVGTPPEALSDPEPVEGVEAGLPWQDVFVHLTRMAQDYLRYGQAEPGRHKVMWHTAKKLRELGVTRAEARRALRWANALKGKDEELPADQIRHALDTAYGS